MNTVEHTRSKRCTHCDRWKAKNDFYRLRNGGSLQSWCKSCVKRAVRARYTKDEIKKKNKAFRKRHPHDKKDRALKSSFGISLIQYNLMLTEQGNACKICGIDQAFCNRKLAVDHNHQTGEIRGLLCGKCNLGIGNLNDDPNLILKAANYLMEHSN